jgi:hypothetical protein
VLLAIGFYPDLIAGSCCGPKQLLASQGPAGRAGIAGGRWQLGFGLSSLLFVVTLGRPQYHLCFARLRIEAQFKLLI